MPSAQELPVTTPRERTPLVKNGPPHYIYQDAFDTKNSGEETTSEESGPQDYQQYEYHTPIQIDCSTSSSVTSPKRQSKRHKLIYNIYRDAFQFALRMAVLLTLSSLFVLVRTQDFHYPDGMWVLVTVLFVSWFPALDAASVVEKIYQRLIGTFVGAAIGLSLGFLSLWLFPDRNIQAAFLACCVFMVIFSVIFLAGQCRVGSIKVIRRYAYATILCVLTFCICMLPFALDEDPKWSLGVYRICNVIVGCVLGALGSIMVCPRSTNAVLHDKTARQVKLAGEASQAVLNVAADVFSGRVHIERLAEELLDTPGEGEMPWKLSRSDSSLTSRQDYVGPDVALKKYEDAIGDWKTSKALFPLMKYDPFSVGKDQAKAFQMELARTLALALRMQTTVVVLDGMIRTESNYSFHDKHFLLFAETGTLIGQMLKVPLEMRKSNAAAEQLSQKLEQIRQSILELSRAVAEDFEADGYSSSMNDDMERGILEHKQRCNHNSLLFLQLVEHLIRRGLRLHHVWKNVVTEAVDLPDESLHGLMSQGSSILG